MQIMGYNQDVISFVFIDKHIKNRVTEVLAKSSYTTDLNASLLLLLNGARPDRDPAGLVIIVFTL